MSEQPEALRLAQCIDFPSVHLGHEAATELRRLHEEVQEQCRINGMGAERELRLMAEKQELLEALKEIEWSNNEQWRTDRARAAIAKAEGETK